MRSGSGSGIIGVPRSARRGEDHVPVGQTSIKTHVPLNSLVLTRQTQKQSSQEIFLTQKLIGRVQQKSSFPMLKASCLFLIPLSSLSPSMAIAAVPSFSLGNFIL